ncbi:gibberellin 2-oxidase 8, ARABIDOPSIS THALIANA GIBBERELLIN 2-OXIDASE 8 [Hibiscus trionum]|uniref:gibberellin 2beta-dioxygenase n=1 Tax=Hibiscus trionum TaxID=183268 RepID=A0A9W7MCI5_HIBTR|nr:gibberellin 2-oxidase 8, ARABIDOPSIS THALIANA GIBBERELLIN 2-OXIDASE 8 [Hibiscus trionum]
MDSDPPFHETYKTLFAENESWTTKVSPNIDRHTTVEEGELPLVDLSRLALDDEAEKESCKEEIARAAKEWGFFQVINHGISRDILDKMREEQVKVFKQPFYNKCREDKFMNFSAGSYRWGTPTATSLRQLSWSEAFHIPMTDISSFGSLNTTFSSSVEQFATNVASLAQKLTEILAEKSGHNSTFFQENSLLSTCYLRLNRYPPCPVPLFGLMPHTDSDFLTVLHQDQIGGLQLVKDGKWIAVKPNPEALFINIGDIFQAWSNDCYKSVQHCVVTNPTKERFSAAYFLCPSNETVIESCIKPSVYRRFSFKEYRQQVQEDVQNYGYKVGLPRFLA